MAVVVKKLGNGMGVDRGDREGGKGQTWISIGHPTGTSEGRRVVQNFKGENQKQTGGAQGKNVCRSKIGVGDRRCLSYYEEKKAKKVNGTGHLSAQKD